MIITLGNTAPIHTVPPENLDLELLATLDSKERSREIDRVLAANAAAAIPDRQTIDGKPLFVASIGATVTRVVPPEGLSLSELLRTVTDLWRQHSVEAPAWVECDDPTIATLLRREFNCGGAPTVEHDDAPVAGNEEGNRS